MSQGVRSRGDVTPSRRSLMPFETTADLRACIKTVSIRELLKGSIFCKLPTCLKQENHATSDYRHFVTSSLALDHVLHKFSCSQDIFIAEMLACKLQSDWDTIEELRIIYGIALAY